jgi:hypothetical protein
MLTLHKNLATSLGYKPKVVGSSPNGVQFSSYLIIPAALGPGVYSASNRNEYRKHQDKYCFWLVKCGWCLGLTTLPPSMSRLSRQCGILNTSQSCRPLQPVMGIALLYFLLSHVPRYHLRLSLRLKKKLQYSAWRL